MILCVYLGIRLKVCLHHLYLYYYVYDYREDLVTSSCCPCEISVHDYHQILVDRKDGILLTGSEKDLFSAKAKACNANSLGV